MAVFTNQATLSYNGTAVRSNVVTGQLVSPLTMTKTAVGGSYSPGGTLSYVVSIVNAGSVTFEGLTLSDDLGAVPLEGGGTAQPLVFEPGSVLFYINGVLQSTITGISVPAGGDTVLVYRAAVTQAAPPAAGGTIQNTAELSGPGLGSPVTAQAEVTAAEGAKLTITKALSPATVQENGSLSYRFTIRNEGNEPAGAEAAVAVADSFSPILKNISVSLDGAPLTRAAQYSYSELSGEFATLPGVITVPAASASQDASTGVWTMTPGETVLTVTGTV